MNTGKQCILTLGIESIKSEAMFLTFIKSDSFSGRFVYGVICIFKVTSVLP